MTTIIVKNSSASPIDLTDLGITIAAGETINFTEIFSKNEIFESHQLKTYVDNSSIVINDGSIDLTSENGLKHIRVETEYEDLFETPTSDSELPSTTVNRSINFPISTSPSAISYNNVIDQNAIGIIEWTSSNATRIYLKQSGLYQVVFQSEKQINVDNEVTIEIRINGSLLTGTQFSSRNNYAYETGDNITHNFRLSSPGYLEIFLTGSQADGNIVNCNLHVIKLQGAKGDKGDPGTGSSIDIMDGTTTFSGISNINFMNFVVTENVPGRADVIYDATSLFRESAVCQVRDTTDKSLPTSYTDISFNTTDLQNSTDTLIHSVSNQDQIIIKKSGLYMVIFVGEFDPTSSSFTNVYARIRKNDSSVIDGGQGHGHFYKTEVHDINMFTYQYFQANDFITLQAYSDDDCTLKANHRLSVIRCDAVKGEDGAPGLSGGDTLAVVQARRTTSISPLSSSVWGDVTFDATDSETFDSYLEHDSSLTDRILIKSPGAYQITYTGNTSDGLIEGRVRVNDTTVVNGSYQKTEPSSTDLDIISASCVIELSGNKYLTFQTRGDTSTVLNNLTLTVLKLEGARGEQGIPGGSDVDIEHDDSLVSENVTKLNFEGNVTVTHETTKTTVSIGSGSSTAIKIFQAYDSNGGTNLNSTTPAAIPLTAEVIKDNYYSHSNSTNSSRVTLLHSGWYRVSYVIGVDNQSNTRKTTRCFARLSGNTEILNSVSYSYSRNSTDTRTSVTATFLRYFNMNEYIEIMGERDGSSGDADTIANECWVLIEFIRE